MQQGNEYQEIVKVRKQDISLHCKQNNRIAFICASPSCPNESFVCSQQSCSCKNLHEVCLLVEPHRLTKMIEKKLIDAKGITQQINKIFDQCIDWLSDWRDQMETELKYYGLSQKQKKFFIAIHSNSALNINGQLMFDIVQSLSKQSSIAQVQQAIKSIQQYWTQQKPNFHSLFNDIQKIVSSPQSDLLSTQSFSSKIIKTKEQFKTFKQFFPKTIKKSRLLYRASENEFSTAKFFDKCSNIPNTVILIETETNKKIGGYTPLCWKIGHSEQNFADPSKSSFLFSLTHGDKFQLKDSSRAIQYYGQGCGPRFGGITGASDLAIKDRANLNVDSYALFNNCYYNENYKKNDTESYQRFSGGNTNFFRIKEWEVFQLEFC